MIRFFDVFFSFYGLCLLSPVFVLISLIIKIDSKGPVFYKQKRVGIFGNDFYLYKFRSMYVDSEKKGNLTVGERDPRITPIGYYIRKYKLDELPQLLNVFKGEMSLVGPRPEVRKYVDLYTVEQKKVLSVRPGITDIASIVFKKENELLEKASNSEEYYIKTILPEKIKLNMIFIEHRNIYLYFKIIFRTIFNF